jgi:hypothetical protein
MRSKSMHMLFVAAAIIAFFGAAAAGEAVLHHVHGLAFSPDGKSLLIPAHIGLAVYRDGRWAKMPGPEHDFMGFSASRDAIYTSGHPAPNSPLRNPLGLMKSTDAGKTWQQLGLSGESDFHVMAAGYRSGVVYVLNSQPNSRMPQPGLYFTKDDGKTWKRGAVAGLSERITSIAVHPLQAETLAIGTMDGVYLSRDFGATFKRIGSQRAASAVLFDLDGKHLYFAAADGSALSRVSLDGKGDTTVPVPKFERDFVLYIAQSPAKPDELAIATRQRHVFLSSDGGKTWKQIAREGAAV